MFLQADLPEPTGTMGLLSLIVAAVIPMLATWLFQWVKQGITALDGAPDLVKQIAYIAFAALMGWLANLLGQALPSDVHALTPDVLTTILLAVANSFVFKAGSTQTKTTATGGTT